MCALLPLILINEEKRGTGLILRFLFHYFQSQDNFSRFPSIIQNSDVWPHYTCKSLFNIIHPYVIYYRNAYKIFHIDIITGGQSFHKLHNSLSRFRRPKKFRLRISPLVQEMLLIT